jgi:hypothetical protein
VRLSLPSQPCSSLVVARPIGLRCLLCLACVLLVGCVSAEPKGRPRQSEPCELVDTSEIPVKYREMCRVVWEGLVCPQSQAWMRVVPSESEIRSYVEHASSSYPSDLDKKLATASIHHHCIEDVENGLSLCRAFLSEVGVEPRSMTALSLTGLRSPYTTSMPVGFGPPSRPYFLICASPEVTVYIELEHQTHAEMPRLTGPDPYLVTVKRGNDVRMRMFLAPLFGKHEPSAEGERGQSADAEGGWGLFGLEDGEQQPASNPSAATAPHTSVREQPIMDEQPSLFIPQMFWSRGAWARMGFILEVSCTYNAHQRPDRPASSGMELRDHSPVENPFAWAAGLRRELDQRGYVLLPVFETCAASGGPVELTNDQIIKSWRDRLENLGITLITLKVSLRRSSSTTWHENVVRVSD